VNAEFDRNSLDIGYTRFPDKCVISVFNWQDQVQTIDVPLPKKNVSITDFWNGKDLGRHQRKFSVKDMPPHSARLLVCT
jgi:alpha-galactosidase